MHRTRMTIFALAIVALGVALAGFSASGPWLAKEPIDKEDKDVPPAEGKQVPPKSEPAWVEPYTEAEIKSKEEAVQERYKRRPGRFGAMAAAASFYEGLFLLKPELRRAKFPVSMDGKVIDSEGDFAAFVSKSLRGTHDDGSPFNKLRRDIFDCREMLLLGPTKDGKELDLAPVGSELSNSDRKKLQEAWSKLKEAHAGKDVRIVYFEMEYWSLGSSKGGDANDIWVTTVLDEGIWYATGWQD